MPFGQAVRGVLMKYAEFTGRAAPSEFWWWILFYYLGLFVFLLVIPRLIFLWFIAMVIPSIAVGVRRMHDSDHSGWWVLLPVVNIVLWCFASTPGTNRFDVPDATATVAPPTAGAPTTACPSCGQARLPGQNFCQGCGTKFS